MCSKQVRLIMTLSSFKFIEPDLGHPSMATDIRLLPQAPPQAHYLLPLPSHATTIHNAHVNAQRYFHKHLKLQNIHQPSFLFLGTSNKHSQHQPS